MTESEKRSRLALAAQARPGPAFYFGWVIAGPMLLYLPLSFLMKHIAGVRAGPAHVVLLLVLIAAGAVFATAFQRTAVDLADRVLKKYTGARTHAEVAAPYLADVAAGAWDVWEIEFDKCWNAMSHDADAQAVLLRVGADQFIYLNTPSLWDVMKKDGTAIRERLVVARGRFSGSVHKIKGEGEWMPVAERIGTQAPSRRDSELLTRGELPDCFGKGIGC